MFIKRLNKVYIPPPLQESGNKNYSLPRKGEVECDQRKKRRLSKDQQEDKIQIFDCIFKVYSMSVDPHGRLICFYSQITDTIYIVSILTLLDYISNFRQTFMKTQQYSFQNSLKPEVLIKNPRPSLHIFQIKFSLSVQNTQLLIVAYYSGVIDIYSVATGKKVDSLDLMDEKNWKLSENFVNSQPSPLFNLNIIGHSIFISTYSGKQFCYEGKQLDLCKKYPEQWIRLAYFQEKEEDQKQKPNKKPKARKVPLYQTRDNRLLLGNSIIQSVEKKEKEKQEIADSYDQYLKLESEKFSHFGYHLKYHLSVCERYLICKYEQFCLSEKSEQSLNYIIRSKFLQWNMIENVVFSSFPVINQFWGIQNDGKQKKSKKKTSKQKDIDLIDYAISRDQILVAVVGEYQKQKIHGNQNCFYIAKIRKQGNTFRIHQICRMTDAKSNILQIHWVGPNILLYLDANSNVYYVQINPSILIEQSI